MSKSEHRWASLWAAVFVGLACLPYLIAWQLAPADTVYTGLLINHFDGESYYAKMQQGARGDWLFHLAFTPEAHDGAFIYTFYLALGHLAAALHLPIPWVYHLARAAAGLLLLLVAYRFIARFFAKAHSRRVAFLLLASSAGFGWLLAPFGITTADLWVAEGFTFLSILTNPHFPLAMALMLLLLLCILQVSPGCHAAQLLWAGGLGLLLAVVQPFAVPVVLAILIVYLAILTWRDRCFPRPQVLVSGAAAAGAAPIMLYDLYVYRTNPALAAWSAQNLTPSLPPWDYALGYGLVLALGIAGAAVAIQRRRRTDLLLLSWFGAVVVLLYLPFALQRRFITGFHLPLTLLAALGLEQTIWRRARPRHRGLATALILGIAALTSAFVPLALVSVSGVAQGQHPLVMTQDEADAWTWLHEHTAWTDTVLTPPELGQFVPAWAGNRVVYGHRFETIDAEEKRAAVNRFYQTQATDAERRTLISRYGVRYVVVPQSDTAVNPEALGLVPAWTGGDLVLYRVEGGQ